MQTIKFRGLSIKENKWVYGMLFHNNKIVTETVSYESPLVEKGSPCYKYEYINIIPETVGQFTGLHDKNGKEIYEKMELNNTFIIKWLNFRYVLFYISDLTIFKEIFDYENKLEITGEYTEL